MERWVDGQPNLVQNVSPDMPDQLPAPGAQLLVDGQLVTLVAVTGTPDGAELVVRRADGSLTDAVLSTAQLQTAVLPENDGQGDPERALLGLWGRWMQHAVPRIRSAVLATRPLRPYAHQDEAVFTHMLAQPRLRFLLADEPGTGKTVMTGMYVEPAPAADETSCGHERCCDSLKLRWRSMNLCSDIS